MINKRSVLTIAFIYIFAFAVFSLKLSAEETNTASTNATTEAKSETASNKENAATENKKATKANNNKKRFSKMYAMFNTNMGDFKVRLFHRRAPKTVENFVGLAEGTKKWTDPKTKKQSTEPFYDGLTFHRVIKGFMIQGGDPLGTGTGGPGFKFDDEFHADLTHSKAGILSMANAGPNTNGSQFFITLGPTPHLDGYGKPRGHSVFGEVVEGMDVVEKIGAVPTNRSNDKPKEDVIIKSLKIIRE